ncbi:MAG: APC family permease, partial [Oscillibacter sp.]
TWLCQAEYCALVAGYAAKLIDLTPTAAYMVKIGVVIIFTIVNIIGLDWLERLETFFIVLVVAGFAAVAIVGFMNWNFNPIQPFFNPEEGVVHSIGGGIAIIIWMYMGYECMSNMAGEMTNPQIIPKAMRISQPVIALSYILPTLAALAAIGSWNSWSTESGAGSVGYADVLIQHVGTWAGVLFIIIAIISNCSIFCSYIAHGSRAFFVMADDHMFPPIMKKVDKRGIPTVSIILLAIFTIITCQFDFTTLVMATNPIQMYLYLMLVACVIKMRKLYPVKDRRALGLAIMPGGQFGMYVMSGSVVLISLLAIYVNGTDYFVTGFLVIFGGLLAYLLCKWFYKGRVLDDPELYPLNPKTKLDLGDLINVGTYMVLSGVMSLGAAVFLYLYERSYGMEYYLEEYGSGLFSNFNAMLGVCIGVGVVLILAGLVMARIGKKTEGPQLKELQLRRKQQLDEMIRELHGAVPGELASSPLVSEQLTNDSVVIDGSKE